MSECIPKMNRFDVPNMSIHRKGIKKDRSLVVLILTRNNGSEPKNIVQKGGLSQGEKKMRTCIRKKSFGPITAAGRAGGLQ